MTALVLQARLDSSRLPQKALLHLGELPLIFQVMRALSFIPCGTNILACPHDSVAAFSPLAEEAGFTVVAGPKEDVLARFCIALRQCGAEKIIRATGDNPFVFADAAAALHHEVLALQADAGSRRDTIDYAAYTGLPYGAGVELVSAEALLRAERETQDASHREHVCPYLYNNGERFRLHRPPAPLRWQGADLRITVDTAEDYQRAQILYERLSTLPVKEQNKGENVIAAYKQCFPEGGE